MLPGMTGPALAREVRTRQPGCRVVYMSGFTANQVAPEVPGGRIDFLQKPFRLDTLRKKVREVLDRPANGPGSPTRRAA
jgi:DNA-binding NtrC family response regulator